MINLQRWRRGPGCGLMGVIRRLRARLRFEVGGVDRCEVMCEHFACCREGRMLCGHVYQRLRVVFGSLVLSISIYRMRCYGISGDGPTLTACQGSSKHCTCERSLPLGL